MLGAVSHYVFGLSLFPSGATVAWSYAKVPLGKTKGTMNPTYCPQWALHLSHSHPNKVVARVSSALVIVSI